MRLYADALDLIEHRAREDRVRRRDEWKQNRGKAEGGKGQAASNPFAGGLLPFFFVSTSSTAGGTICDSYVWNARICIELCGGTAQYSSDPSSGTYGTSGIVQGSATCSNWGRNGIESATTTAFDFDGGR